MSARWLQELEWVQVDGWGRIGAASFTGTHEDLLSHLSGDLVPHERIETEETMVYLAEQGDDREGGQLLTLCVTVAGPWAHQKWIPRPTQPRDF